MQLWSNQYPVMRKSILYAINGNYTQYLGALSRYIQELKNCGAFSVSSKKINVVNLKILLS